MTNKVRNNVVDLTCFYPISPDNACGQKIAPKDIHQIVPAQIWNKYQKFKANLSHIYSRQCPFCEHTQTGDPEQPMMVCQNIKCAKYFCLYHNNAHNESISCEKYELSIAKMSAVQFYYHKKWWLQSYEMCEMCVLVLLAMFGDY